MTTVTDEIDTGIREFVRDTVNLSSREAATVLADVFTLDHGDRVLGAARVRVLFTAVPGLSQRRVDSVMVVAQVKSRDRVLLRELSEKQRTVVAAQLRLWAEERGS